MPGPGLASREARVLDALASPDARFTVADRDGCDTTPRHPVQDRCSSPEHRRSGRALDAAGDRATVPASEPASAAATRCALPSTASRGC